MLPEELDVERIGADEQRLQIEVDRLLGQPRRERCVAEGRDPAMLRFSLYERDELMRDAGQARGDRLATPGLFPTLLTPVFASLATRTTTAVVGSGVEADITLRISALEINTQIPGEAFDVDVPPDARPMTLQELRRAGPLGDRTR